LNWLQAVLVYGARVSVGISYAEPQVHDVRSVSTFEF